MLAIKKRSSGVSGVVFVGADASLPCIVCTEQFRVIVGSLDAQEAVMGHAVIAVDTAKKAGKSGEGYKSGYQTHLLQKVK